MTLREDDFQRLAAVIKTKYGLNLYGKKFLVQSRLTNYVLDCGFDNFTEYFNSVYADSSGNEMANVINRLTTNYTYFFREEDHFRHFKEVFLREAEKTVADRDLRIWSAGCSFGNEPYSFAMCMDDHFGFRKSWWDTRILATDISFNALRMAQKGVFSPQSVDNLPPRWLDKYFIKQDNGTYRIQDQIRQSVIFRYHNLMDPIIFKKKFDLIICRNVMIYFDEQTKRELIKRFYNATEEGGYLYIGHAETCPKETGYKMIQPAIFRKM